VLPPMDTLTRICFEVHRTATSTACAPSLFARSTSCCTTGRRRQNTRMLPRSSMNCFSPTTRTESGFYVGDRSRGRFARPAGFPLHDCTPYSGLHARPESLGFVHRTRTIFCRHVPNPSVSIRNFCIAVPTLT
jgi:hypothetical protein